MNSSFIWLGFLPILAYVALDSFSGRITALWGALALGAAELAFTLIRFKALDYLSVVAFLMLAAFVALSLRTRNDFYFKIQGALVNILSAFVLLGGWYLFHKALLLDMAVKYVGLDQLAAMNPALDKDMVAEMLRVLSLQLPWWLLLHSLFTIYAAANWSKWAWAFVRIPGFFVALFMAANFAGAAAMHGAVK